MMSSFVRMLVGTGSGTFSILILLERETWRIRRILIQFKVTAVNGSHDNDRLVDRDLVRVKQCAMKLFCDAKDYFLYCSIIYARNRVSLFFISNKNTITIPSRFIYSHKPVHEVRRICL